MCFIQRKTQQKRGWKHLCLQNAMYVQCQEWAWDFNSHHRDLIGMRCLSSFTLGYLYPTCDLSPVPIIPNLAPLHIVTSAYSKVLTGSCLWNPAHWHGLVSPNLNVFRQNSYNSVCHRSIISHHMFVFVFCLSLKAFEFWNTGGSPDTLTQHTKACSCVFLLTHVSW